MVILRTQSQLRSFLHRKGKEYNYSHDEGCGCCHSYSNISFDEKTNKVLKKHDTHHINDHYWDTEVIAIYRERHIEVVT
jgi:hypothetical protein